MKPCRTGRTSLFTDAPSPVRHRRLPSVCAGCPPIMANFGPPLSMCPRPKSLTVPVNTRFGKHGKVAFCGGMSTNDDELGTMSHHVSPSINRAFVFVFVFVTVIYQAQLFYFLCIRIASFVDIRHVHSHNCIPIWIGTCTSRQIHCGNNESLIIGGYM